MKCFLSMGLAATFAVGASLASAGELQSGLQEGQHVGAFNVVKCGGAPDDGVALGKELCYR